MADTDRISLFFWTNISSSIHLGDTLACSYDPDFRVKLDCAENELFRLTILLHVTWIYCVTMNAPDPCTVTTFVGRLQAIS